jgi:hypothetical protein
MIWSAGTTSRVPSPLRYRIAIACFVIDLMEADFLAFPRRGKSEIGQRHKRNAQVTCSPRTRGHGTFLATITQRLLKPFRYVDRAVATPTLFV